MIYDDDNSTYRLHSEGAVIGYGQFKSGNIARAIRVFQDAEDFDKDMFSPPIEDLLFIMRSRAHCYAELGKKRAVADTYNEMIRFQMQFIGSLQQSIENTVETYKYRYGKELELSPDNLAGAKKNNFTLDDVFERRKDMLVSTHRRFGELVNPQSSKLSDPFSCLPNEVVSNVMGNLSTSDLRSALFVSRRWNHAVMSLSSYLVKPVFVEDATVSAMKMYLQKCKESGIRDIQSIRIAGLSCYQEIPLMAALASSKLRVRSLDIATTKEFTNNDCFYDENDNMARTFSKVESLSVTFRPTFECMLGEFIKCFKSLKHLSITMLCDGPPEAADEFEGWFKVGKLDSFDWTIKYDGPRWGEWFVSRVLADSRIYNVKKLSLNLSLNAEQLAKIVRAARPSSLRLEKTGLSSEEVFSVLDRQRVKPTTLILPDMPIDSGAHPCLSRLSTFEFTGRDTHLDSISTLLASANIKVLRCDWIPLSFSAIFKSCPLLEEFSMDASNNDLELLGQALGYLCLKNLKTLCFTSENVSLSAFKAMLTRWVPDSLTIYLHKDAITRQKAAFFNALGIEYRIGRPMDK